MTGSTDTTDRADAEPRRPVFDSDLCDARSRKYLLAAAILASALGFIDGSVVAIALPAMRSTLGASLGEAQWMANAYLLTLSSLILVGGALGDRFGVARIFGLGIAAFVAASMVCAVAPSPGLLIAARACQGTGAALMVPGSLALISRAYPREERGQAIGIWAAASALTTALGPVIGGGVLSAFGDSAWRWIFAVNLPLGGAALWLVWRHAGAGRVDPDKRIDIIGAILATTGLLLIAWGLSGAEGNSGDIRWGLAASGLAVFLAFVASQAIVAGPMVPLPLFRSAVFASANLLSFFLYFALTAMLFFLPMTLISAWQVSPLAASAAFAPLSVFISLMSPRIGRLADRIGPRAPIAAGSALVAIAYAGLATLVPLQSYWGIVVPAMALAGFGMGLVVAPLSAAVMGAVSDAESGTASGINNAVTRVAGLIAVALAGAVAGLVYRAAGGPESFAAAGVTGAAHLDATNAGFRAVAWMCAALSAVSALVAWIGLRPRT